MDIDRRDTIRNFYVSLIMSSLGMEYLNNNVPSRLPQTLKPFGRDFFTPNITLDFLLNFTGFTWPLKVRTIYGSTPLYVYGSSLGENSFLNYGDLDRHGRESP